MHPGIYIMQNTMVRGGGMASWGKNKNLELGKKLKGERKKEENYTKKRLKKCIFLGYKLKKNRTPRRKLILRGNKLISKEGGGDDQNAEYISLYAYMLKKFELSF